MLDTPYIERVDLPINTWAIKVGVRERNELRRLDTWTPERRMKFVAWCVKRFIATAEKKSVVFVDVPKIRYPDMPMLMASGRDFYALTARAIQWPDDVPRRPGLKVDPKLHYLTLPVMRPISAKV